MRGLKISILDIVVTVVLLAAGIALHWVPTVGAIAGRVVITAAVLNIAFLFITPKYRQYRGELLRDVRWWFVRKFRRWILGRRPVSNRFPTNPQFPTASPSTPPASTTTAPAQTPKQRRKKRTGRETLLDSKATEAVHPPSLKPSEVPAQPVIELALKTTRMSSSRASGYDKIGSGGEAVVYKVDDETAIKVFRQPDDEWYSGDDPEQARQREQAASRLADYPEKLPQFPRWVGSRVVAPSRLLRMGSYAVGGYQMRLIADADPLRKYTSSRFKRKKKVGLDALGRLMLDLYDTVCELHACGMLIGDFKPENILVKDGKCFIVDAESTAYGDFRCRTFSDNYVDPRLCDPALDYQLLVKPYDRDADWYAFTVILFEVLANLNPYAGVYTAPPGEKVVKQEERPLRLISVFNSNVTVPNFTESIEKIPLALQRFFFNTFEAGLRGRPKRKMIEELVSGNVPTFVPADHTCWAGHALPAATAIDQETLVLPSLLEPDCRLLTSGMYDGALRYLYQRGAEVFREDGSLLLENDGDDFNVFQVGPNSFLFGTDHENGEDQLHDGPFYFIEKGEKALMVPHVDPTPDGTPNIGIQNNRVVWIERGNVRTSQHPSPLAELPGTLELFSGLSFDLILSMDRGAFSELYLLNKDKLRRLTALPPFMGCVHDIECVFASKVAWLFLTTLWAGRRTRHLIVLDSRGKLLALGAAPESQSAWHAKGMKKTAYSVKSGTKRIRVEHHLAVLTPTGVVELTIDKKSLAVEIKSNRAWQAEAEPQALVYTEAGLAVAIDPVDQPQKVDHTTEPASGIESETGSKTTFGDDDQDGVVPSDVSSLFSFNIAQ